MDGIGPAHGPAPAGSVTTPAPSWRLSSISTSGLTAACIVVLLLCLTGRFLWQYNKIAAAEAQSSSSAASSSRTASSSLPVGQDRRGGEALSLSLLPVFVQLGGPAEETAAECAVCLAEFAVGQAGRSLPRCGHGFHEDCIATWLRLNTTCPLCRAPVAAAK